ncbi:MAG: hypothetical protein H7A24_03715 [Leptospiraceae bacterium]|nr:hypothetical protein [Leptospiraceae bacterium]MCP5510959.1 hypothetical protein [Leptospiraceae bacterium]
MYFDEIIQSIKEKMDTLNQLDQKLSIIRKLRNGFYQNHSLSIYNPESSDTEVKIENDDIVIKNGF